MWGRKAKKIRRLEETNRLLDAALRRQGIELLRAQEIVRTESAGQWNATPIYSMLSRKR